MSQSKKPSQVRIATTLLYVCLVLNLAGPFLEIRAYGWLPIFLILPFAFTLLITLILIEGISVGRNWARITYIVATILGLPFMLYAFRHHLEDSHFLAFSLSIQFVMQAIAMCLVFFGRGAMWFKRSRA